VTAPHVVQTYSLLACCLAGAAFFVFLAVLLVEGALFVFLAEPVFLAISTSLLFKKQLANQPCILYH
jgi:hypothetical protein